MNNIFYIVSIPDPDGICLELCLTKREADNLVKMYHGKIYEMNQVYYMETKANKYGYYDVYENYFSTKEKAKQYLAAHPEETVSHFALLKPPIDLDSDIREFVEQI